MAERGGALFRSKARILMDITLHQRASDSHYGQWPLAFPKESEVETRVHCP